MNIIKRDGSEAVFDASKIIAAINKAANEVNPREINGSQAAGIARNIENYAKTADRALSVEEIQELVETGIMQSGGYETAKKYIKYRYRHAIRRELTEADRNVISIMNGCNEATRQENSNKNALLLSTQRDYIAGEESKRLCTEFIFPDKLTQAHEKGMIHIHDMDYIAMRMTNCCLVNLEDMLQNGTYMSEIPIEPPKSFAVACNVATQIIAQVASNRYGGQTITLAHLAPFVDVSRKKIRNKLMDDFDRTNTDYDEETLDYITERRLYDEIKSGIQTIQYQLITLMTTNGQTPFITLSMYIDEAPEGRTRDDLVLIIKEVIRQRMKGIKDKNGHYMTIAFPKLIYVLDEDNCRPGTKYWEVTQLAGECSMKRMVPDYISAKKMREFKDGHVYPCMGCRSFLTNEDGIKNPDGTNKFYGRFNQGVCTVNLVHAACSSGGDMDRFWTILDERLEMCHNVLQIRHERLLGTVSDVAPILWQHGAYARLKPGETIDKLLYGGYSTISLGYAGLYECTYYMTGASHTGDGKEFAEKVMKRLNDKCAEWRAAENIAYSVYGTPMESTTYKFAKCLQNQFGIIPEVTDHNYITNSYHVNVREKIDAFSKLLFESEFQALSPGGAISYVEVPNLEKNPQAGMSVICFIYDNIMYAEINTRADYCMDCGFEGEISIVRDEHGKPIWKCPKCGNTAEKRMQVARRTCGYIGSQYWNQGRTAEINDRVVHLSPEAASSEPR